MNDKLREQEILRRIKEGKLKPSNESAAVRHPGFAQDGMPLDLKLAQPIRKVKPIVDPKKIR
jgi:hypothetical protein